MHELYKLENIALEGYASYNFPKGTINSTSVKPVTTYYLLVINALTHFTNTTLSSLYFDITKDCLYANAKQSPERRAVVMVLDQVKSRLTSNSLRN